MLLRHPHLFDTKAQMPLLASPFSKTEQRVCLDSVVSSSLNDPKSVARLAASCRSILFYGDYQLCTESPAGAGLRQFSSKNLCDHLCITVFLGTNEAGQAPEMNGIGDIDLGRY